MYSFLRKKTINSLENVLLDSNNSHKWDNILFSWAFKCLNLWFQNMTVKTKFYEVDLKPVCKKCYDRYPRELRLRLKKYHDNEAAREQGGPIAAK